MTTDMRRLVARRGDRAAWSAVATAPIDGELIYNKTSHQLRVGDGATLPDALPAVGREDQSRINVRDYGAVGDGVTDDSAAFLAAFTAAVADSVTTFDQYGDRRSQHSIYIPAGTYLITSNASLIADVGSGLISGFVFRGAGIDATHIVFQPTAANQYLAYNNDRFYHLTFENMSFHGAGANAATATIFNTVSNGHAQNYVFFRCNFMGTWKYGLKLTGTNNNSENTLYSCGIHAAFPSGAFLYSPTSGTGSDQFVNHTFVACNVEYPTGDFIQMATGGNINVYGGSYIHSGDGSETTSTAQCFFKLLGASHNAGAPRIHVQGIRVEHRHRQSQLIYCEWSYGSVLFESVDCDTDAWILTGPQNVIECEFGANANSYPRIRFEQCMLMGKQKYHYNSATYANSRPNIVYDGCTFDDAVNQYKRAVDFFTFTNVGGTANTAGIPVVHVVNSHATFNVDQKEVFDTHLNWHLATNVAIPTEQVSVRPATGGLPGLSGVTTAFVNLPINSLISRVQCVKDTAGGTSTATNVTYTLTDADAATVVTAQTVSAGVAVAWNSTWQWDSAPMWRRLTTDNKRTLTLTSANITEASVNSFFVIEYKG